MSDLGWWYAGVVVVPTVIMAAIGALALHVQARSNARHAADEAARRDHELAQYLSVLDPNEPYVDSTGRTWRKVPGRELWTGRMES